MKKKNSKLKKKKTKKQRNGRKHGPQARLVQFPALWRRKQKAESRTLSYNFLLFPLLFKVPWLFDLQQRGTVAIFMPEACLHIPLSELYFTVNGKGNYWLIFKTTCNQNGKLLHHCSFNSSFLKLSLIFFFFLGLCSPKEWDTTWPLNVKIPLKGITVNSGAIHHTWMANICRNQLHDVQPGIWIYFIIPLTSPPPQKQIFN